jgi:hypothetical protein
MNDCQYGQWLVACVPESKNSNTTVKVKRQIDTGIYDIE